MKIMFIGSGIKEKHEADIEEDIMNLLIQRIKTKIAEEVSPEDFKYEHKFLSEYCEIDEENQEYILSTNMEIKKHKNIVQVNIKRNSYDDSKIDILVKIISKYNEHPDLIIDEFLHSIKICISKCVSKFCNEVYWLLDEQNQMISESLYVKVHEVENMFRTIINQYMLKRFGSNWFQSKINQLYKSKSKEFSSWYQDKYGELNYIKSEIFNLQTNDLILMLKDSYENELITKVLKQINSIKSELGEKSREIIRENILDGKSLWEKYFQPLFDEDIESEWSIFSKMRNNIAHNKLLSFKFVKDMFRQISKLEQILNNASIKVDKKIESIEYKMIDDYIRKCNYEMDMDLLGYSIYYNDDEVVEVIEETDDMITLRGIINDKIQEIQSLYEDFKNLLYDIELSYDDVDEVFKSKLMFINNLVNYNDKDIINMFIYNSTNVNELNEVGTYLNKLKNIFMKNIDKYKNETYFNESFNDGVEICRFYNLCGNKFSLNINGWFTIEDGNSDEIFINYKKDEELVQKGIVSIIFGDYSLLDYGQPMPEVDENISSNMKDVINAIERNFDEVIEELQEIIYDLYELD